MSNPKFYHPDVSGEVMALLLQKIPPGMPVTEKDIANAREIVWCRHALDTIAWKQQYMTLV